MNELKLFENQEFGRIRVVVIDGEPLGRMWRRRLDTKTRNEPSVTMLMKKIKG